MRFPFHFTRRRIFDMNSHGASNGSGKVGGGQVIGVMSVPRLKTLAREAGLRLNWPNAESAFMCAHCGDPINQNFSILEEEGKGKVRKMGCPARHTPQDLAGRFRIVRDRESNLFAIIKMVLPDSCLTSLDVPAPAPTVAFSGKEEGGRKRRRRRKHRFPLMRAS